jgi:hypothetical protein
MNMELPLRFINSLIESYQKNSQWELESIEERLSCENFESFGEIYQEFEHDSLLHPFDKNDKNTWYYTARLLWLQKNYLFKDNRYAFALINYWIDGGADKKGLNGANSQKELMSMLLKNGTVSIDDLEMLLEEWKIEDVVQGRDRKSTKTFEIYLDSYRKMNAIHVVDNAKSDDATTGNVCINDIPENSSNCIPIGGDTYSLKYANFDGFFDSMFVNQEDKEQIEYCFGILKKVTPPIVTSDNKFNLGSKSKSAITAWFMALKVKGIISSTVSDEKAAKCLNSKIEGLYLYEDGRTLRNPGTTKYKQYYDQIINFINDFPLSSVGKNR